MAADITTLGSLLKEHYDDAIKEQLNNANVILANIDKKPRKMTQGKQWYVPLHTGRNEGIGAVGDGGALPDPGNQAYQNAVYPSTYQYCVVEITGPAMSATRNDLGSWAEAQELELMGAVRDLKRDLNRQIWHDGSNMLTAATDTASSTTVTVTSTKFIKVGAKISIAADTSPGALNAGTMNQSVLTVPNATTFTVTTAIDVAANEAVYRASAADDDAGAVNAGTAFQALWGLEAIINTANPPGGNLGGIDRTAADTDYWDASLFNPATTTVSNIEDQFQEMLDTVDIESGMLPGLILTNHANRRLFGESLLVDRRFTKNTIEYEGGFTGLDFGGIGVVADRDASFAAGTAWDHAYFINLDDLVFLQETDGMEWSDEDGSVLKWKSGFDAFQAFLKKYCQLAPRRCNTHGRMDFS